MALARCAPAARSVQAAPVHVRSFLLSAVRDGSSTSVRCDLIRGDRLFASRQFPDDAIEKAAQLGRLWLSIGPAVLIVER